MVPIWQEIPDNMKNPSVEKYFKLLEKKKVTLVIKRAFDILFSLVLIILLAIPMVVIAIMIKADSKGPVMYRQERVTQYGKVFRIFKFRTMVDNADRMGSHVTTMGDSRITGVGSKLRKSRLDEFPQLFNILKGEMSSEALRYVDYYTDEMKATLLLPAGVTSMTSILYKDEGDLLEGAENPDQVYVEKILPEKMKYNMEYLENISLWEDIKTILATVKRVLT